MTPGDPGATGNGPLGPLTPGMQPSPESPSFARLDPTLWQVWWRFNRDGYLDLKRRMSAPETTGGAAQPAAGEVRLDARLAREKVVPALLATLEAGGPSELVRPTLIALARIEASLSGEAEIATVRLASHFLRTGPDACAEASVVALGVRGDPSSAPLLIDLLLDTEAGRKVLGADAVNFRVRSLAAYALGLLGERDTDPALRRQIASAFIRSLESNANAPYDAQLASLVGMGLVPMEPCDEPEGSRSDKPQAEHFCRGRQIALLLDYMVDPRRHDRLRAQAAVPLARLTIDSSAHHRRSVIESFLLTIHPRSKSPAEIQQACVIALGLLGDCDGDALDGDVRQALLHHASRGDRLSRPLALISLARIAARAGEGGEPDKVRGRILDELVRQLARSKEGLASWAALALGVLGHSLEQAGEPVPNEAAPALRTALSSTRSSDRVAACALALGLLRDRGAQDAVRSRLERSKAEGEQASIALALGLIRAEESRDELRKLAKDAGGSVDAHRNAALALRLLGDLQASEELARAAAAEEDPATRAALVSALGLVGDARSAESLCGFLLDAAQTKEVRAAASAALGELCDLRPRAWCASLSTDLHYDLLASTLISYAGNGSGILEMR